jgi:hypothetical protein
LRLLLEWVDLLSAFDRRRRKGQPPAVLAPRAGSVVPHESKRSGLKTCRRFPIQRSATLSRSDDGEASPRKGTARSSSRIVGPAAARRGATIARVEGICSWPSVGPTAAAGCSQRRRGPRPRERNERDSRSNSGARPRDPTLQSLALPSRCSLCGIIPDVRGTVLVDVASPRDFGALARGTAVAVSRLHPPRKDDGSESEEHEILEEWQAPPWSCLAPVTGET